MARQTARHVVAAITALAGAALAAPGCTSGGDVAVAPGTALSTASEPTVVRTTAPRIAPATVTGLEATPPPEPGRIEISARRVVGGQATLGSLSADAQRVADAVAEAMAHDGDLTDPREGSAIWCSAIAWPDVVYVVRVLATAADESDGGWEGVELRTVAAPVFGGSAAATATFVWDGVTHVSVDAVMVIEDGAGGTFAAITGDGVTFEGAFRCGGTG